MAQAYADLLAGAGITRGLIGPREVPRLWDRHLVNCGLLAAAFDDGTTVADIGSGAGLPGIPIAIARPDVCVVLVEPLLRRATFLQEAVAALGLDNVEVVRARAEELAGHRAFPVVTARAVARLDKLAGWTLPLVAPGGWLVAMKGAAVTEELDGARRAIQRLGGEVVGVEQYGADLATEPTTAVRVRVSDTRAAGSSSGGRSARRKRGRGSGKR
ncbi:16S rRNA (guanine(527)-N(7))-methyltransferase RsmG [Marmoricola endophyticus]|uniref:16S rRNA (guanine(527)-N(7))-methyltransferase RsmG n=1 Tax=Marmoricola endophyticus TaxID=2040280 RepID=UPI0027E46434|nr:16S rRNA (guanine(527)-N(7))-methyltransferase RsmG [Marmoricola endophyticus]